jgi:hypothetical protein
MDRPSTIELFDKLIIPNNYKVRVLTVNFFRSNLIKLINFLSKLEKNELRKLTVGFEGGFEDGNFAYP